MFPHARAFSPAGFALLGCVWLGTPWVLASTNLVWRADAGFREAALAIAENGRNGFTRLDAAATGVTFSNHLDDATVAKNRLYENGSGVALGDVDGDGWVDLYFCCLQGDNVLYRNLGNWRFQAVTAEAGVACPNQFSTGCVLADLDGDGSLDLLVNSLGGGTRAFLNDGKGHFTESAEAGLLRRYGATSMALADVDGDGDLDLYVANYRTDTVHDHPPGLIVQTRRQPDGHWVIEPADRFVTLPKPDGGVEAVERGEPDVLYINRGRGRFVPVPWVGGLFLDEQGDALTAAPTDWGLSVVFRDLNHDGLPDLYLCNDFVFWPDRLWLNVRGSRFQAAPRRALRCTSLSSMVADVADVNRDGFDDIFVADMVSPRREFRAWQRPDILEGTVRWPLDNPDFRPEVPRNTLQLARGDGTYAEIAPLAGLAATDWTWNVAFIDIDLDGWEDLLVATGSNHDVQDVDAIARIVASGGWKTPERRMESLRQLAPRAASSTAWRNRHDLTFEDASARWGVGAIGRAQGLALGDLDNDGDLDVVMNVLNGPAWLFRNESPAPRVAVRLRGAGANTRGIGARLKVIGGPVTQTQEMIAGGRYLSSDDPLRVFAAGRASKLEIEVIWRSGKRSVVPDAGPNHIYEISEASARMTPPSSATPAMALFEEVANWAKPVRAAASGTADERRRSSEGGVSRDPDSRDSRSSPLREEGASGLLHVDTPFNDFARQPLLPRKLSTLGPGIAWADVDQDGRDDLALSGGKGGTTAVFTNSGQGRFTQIAVPALPHANPRDQTGLVAWRGQDGRVRLLVGESKWEDTDTNTPAFRVFEFYGRGGGTHSAPLLMTAQDTLHRPLTPSLFPPTGEGVRRAGEGDDGERPSRYSVEDSLSATGPLTMADVDGDGHLDLFVGGRVRAGRYPESATSVLLRGDGASFRVTRVFADLGLVSGAVFSDWDGDGDPDLALACEWDTPRTFRNDRGAFTETTAKTGLAALRGWWNAITAGDFDGDGRMDLAVANWGRNWRVDQPPGVEAPVQLYYGEFAGDGIVQTVLASHDPWLKKVTPWRERSAIAAAMPAVAGRLPDHHAYGRAGVAEVLGDAFAGARRLEATTSDSMLLLNRGDHFETRPLPIEAQFAPAFGISVADFDGNGQEDLFLAQNFFGVDAETARHDAGMGLVLLGDGRGGFRALHPGESGIAVYGEQRGSAVADFDGDGRIDLAVTQHAGQIRLFRNVRSQPGVRIKLQGSLENPDAVGALVRLKFDGHTGPARETHAGAGYWSQDSTTLVLAAPTPPIGVWIRWPGGDTQEWPWPSGAQSVVVSRTETKPATGEMVR